MLFEYSKVLLQIYLAKRRLREFEDGIAGGTVYT
jgi:hypothetical protein